MLSSLSYKILTLANQEISRSAFLKEVSILLVDKFSCSDLKLLLKIPQSETNYEFVHYSKDSFNYEIISIESLALIMSKEKLDLWYSILNNSFDSESTFFTEKGTFWTINFDIFSILERQKNGLNVDNITLKNEDNNSLLIVPFLYSNVRAGLIQLEKFSRDVFSNFGKNHIEDFTENLNAIMINQYTQSLLQERIKELSFLYEMANITKNKSYSFEEMIHQIIKIIPAAWQYPKITSVRININGIEYTNKPICNLVHKLESDIIVDNKKVGNIEVIYTEKCPKLFDGPFFEEETKLLNNIAAELATIVK